MPRFRKRDEAVSFQLPENESGNIKALVDFGDYLEVYTETSTYKMVSPDSLDPESINDNMPWVYTKTADVGSRHSIVADTILMANEVLGKAIFTKDIDKVKLIMKVKDIKLSILECFDAIHELEKDIREQVNKFEKNSKLSNGGSAHLHFPQSKVLGKTTAAILIHAKRSIQEISAMINIFIPLKVVHGRIDKLIAEIKTSFSEYNDVISYLEDNLRFCERVFDLRNGEEHSLTSRKPLEIENFYLTPQNNIIMPTWGLKGDVKNSVLDEVFKIINFLVEFFENIFLICVHNFLIKNPKMVLINNPGITDDLPIRYSVSISPEWINSRFSGGSE
ncbi:hypothetical protein AB6869_21020 [Rahnella rivi]|uniref:hypothetical protein n=1 Tax=Rahnella rivi TaxID=2816249 RepID=UPI0039BDE361